MQRRRQYALAPSKSFLRLVLVEAIIVISLVLVFWLVFIPRGANITSSTSSLPPSAGAFRVQGNKIYDPMGKPFIVKGVTAIYGRFAGGDAHGFGLTNYRYAERDLDNLKRAHVNLVRLFVSADYADLSPDSPNYVAMYMQELDTVVQWITQRGMVAEVSNSVTSDFATSLQFVRQFAARYKDNAYVWIEPMNEPNCNTSTGDPTKCRDWAYWQRQQQQYIQAIRGAGMTSPIVVNSISWSWDLSKIASYPLNDSNVIYGAHRYPSPDTNYTFNATDQADCDKKWANLAGKFPIIVDEVGPANNRKTYLPWGQRFIDYVTEWVNTRGGAGAIAFVYYWSDGNSMTDDPRRFTSKGVFNQWGEIFYKSYLTKVE